MTGGAPWSQTPVAVAAATLGAGMVMFYAVTLVNQEDVWLSAIPFVLALAAGAGFAYAAAIRREDRRRFLTVTTEIFLVVGLLGIMTIGILFLIVATVAGLGALLSHPTSST